MAADLLERHDALVPEALLAAVARHYAPQQVILFGSRARGEAGPDSDWDLLVIVDDGAEPGRFGTRGVRWPGDVNIITCPRSHFEARRDVVGSMANMADEDGITVWRRPGVPDDRRRRRRVVSEREQWQEASAWLDRAERDLEVARLIVRLGDAQLANTAFHLQQTVEKILKGLLAARAAPFRKVHKLGELAERVTGLFPELAAELEGLDPFTAWVVAGRYHDAPDEGAPITRDNVAALLQRCEALLAKARELAPRG
jgi:HEPN domain-containing protein